MDKGAFSLTAAFAGETARENFDRILGGESFKGLKAILNCVAADASELFDVFKTANSYEDLLSRLGYQLTLTKQIHVNDCYERVGPSGGIKAVLPYHDTGTQRSLPTLINLDHTVTTTYPAAAFFNESFVALKSALSGQN